MRYRLRRQFRHTARPAPVFACPRCVWRRALADQPFRPTAPTLSLYAIQDTYCEMSLSYVYTNLNDSIIVSRCQEDSRWISGRTVRSILIFAFVCRFVDSGRAQCSTLK